MTISRALGLRVCLVLATALAGLARADAPNSPTEVVERLHAGLIEVMQQAEALGYAGRTEKLVPLVDGAYDLPFMARSAVGREWQKLSEAERQELVAAFGRLSVASYAGRFKGYSGERFETLGEEDAVRDTRLVRTKLVRTDEEPIELDYRLRNVNDEWRIIDVYMNGTVSELALRRAEYSALLKRKGFPALLEAIDSTIAELQAS